MNAGRSRGQLSACFVLPVEDSIPSIFGAIRDMAIVQQTGGGTGFAFGRLRPSGDRVESTGGISSGPLPFMEVFNSTTDTIKQGGRRRGANMGVLDVHHPDVLAFITAKADPARLRNFNLSVALTREFLAAVAAGEPYALRNPRTGEAVRRIDARRVLELLCRAAHLSGEPGVLFIDRINDDHPTPHLGRIESTNPCAELPLLPFESCTLGSLNLAAFAGPGGVDYPLLEAAVRLAVRFLDDVIDVTAFPLPEVAAATRATRKVGLGIMGFADLLVALGLPYDDDRALAVADEVMGFVHAAARRASEALAAERGPFPAWADSAAAARGETPRRHATTTTIAPTGTLSILAGCSAGIEPLFAPVYRRRMLEDEEILEVHPTFQQRLAAAVADPEPLFRAVAEAGHAHVPGVPAAIARLFVTAHEVTPARHVEMQAAFQRHVDSAVAKTVNLPATATVADVAEVIRLAERLGCKGITVYRDGSRTGQVLTSGLLSGPAPALAPAAGPVHCPACGAATARSGPIVYCPACAWSG
jgi:ribonucleoside-diphosphate reductase alpha chain